MAEMQNPNNDDNYSYFNKSPKPRKSIRIPQQKTPKLAPTMMNKRNSIQ